MKFSQTLIIKAHIDNVIECYTNDKLRSQWDSMIESKEHIEGTPLQAGSKSRIYFKTPNGPQELMETILENKLPSSIKGLYEHSHMNNTLETQFNSLHNGHTEVILNVDYFKAHKFIVKVFMKLFPGQFKKQVDKTMNEFKNFVEQY